MHALHAIFRPLRNNSRYTSLFLATPPHSLCLLVVDKVSFRLGKRYVLCEGTVLNQKTYALRVGFLVYLFHHESLSGCVHFVPHPLSVRDPGSLVRKLTSFRLGKRSEKPQGFS